MYCIIPDIPYFCIVNDAEEGRKAGGDTEGTSDRITKPSPAGTHGQDKQQKGYDRPTGIILPDKRM